MVSVCQSGFLFVQRKNYLQELISIKVLWLRFPRDLFSSFFLFSLSASDQLGVVADGQTALWAWPGPEPWRDGELTDVSRIKHAEQVSTLPPARPPSGRQSRCALIWHHLSVCLQPNGEAWWWWQTRDPLPSRPCGGAWALGDLHASRGGLAFPFPLTELCQRGIKNVIYLLLCGLCMSTVNLLTPMCFFFGISLQQDDTRNTPSQRHSPAPSLDRLVPERVSKRSMLSLDLNANENGVSEQSGSESIDDGKRGTTQKLERMLELMVFYFCVFKYFNFLFLPFFFFWLVLLYQWRSECVCPRCRVEFT